MSLLSQAQRQSCLCSNLCHWMPNRANQQTNHWVMHERAWTARCEFVFVFFFFEGVSDLEGDRQGTEAGALLLAAGCRRVPRLPWLPALTPSGPDAPVLAF
ncbi:unnamed protein product [Prorocentrum cordatum]|uniref:Uncharacterized protein n=1 Tax=Prorocentrum cordatum TaxID=2364126 RepID=A0ABN9WPB1_9DINO|nr:unnamed protein product [Polarella glacialis]